MTDDFNLSGIAIEDFVNSGKANYEDSHIKCLLVVTYEAYTVCILCVYYVCVLLLKFLITFAPVGIGV